MRGERGGVLHIFEASLADAEPRHGVLALGGLRVCRTLARVDGLALAAPTLLDGGGGRIEWVRRRVPRLDLEARKQHRLDAPRRREVRRGGHRVGVRRRQRRARRQLRRQTAPAGTRRTAGAFSESRRRRLRGCTSATPGAAARSPTRIVTVKEEASSDPARKLGWPWTRPRRAWRSAPRRRCRPCRRRSREAIRSGPSPPARATGTRARSRQQPRVAP